ncbi:MAG: thioesterase family protein [Acidimicrobiia bacterium]|nr:thioesterase family protein [Acidimicrobiia bacterium]
MTQFEKDTALTRLGDGRFGGHIDEAWWVYRGPHGGYVGAIVMRAMVEAVANPSRPARSFTIHYLAPPKVGPVEVETTIERSGGAMTSVSARLIQDGQPMALALGAFSKSRDAPEYVDVQMPDVPPPSRVPPMSMEASPPHIRFFEHRQAIGPAPFSGGDEAISGGWLRLAEPQILDAPLLVEYADGWMPAVFSRTQERVGVPTVDLSVHFRVPVPMPDASPDDFVLVIFSSPVARDGFLVEDGQIWSQSGELIAESRQLAAMLPIR